MAGDGSSGARRNTPRALRRIGARLGIHPFPACQRGNDRPLLPVEKVRITGQELPQRA